MDRSATMQTQFAAFCCHLVCAMNMHRNKRHNCLYVKTKTELRFVRPSQKLGDCLEKCRKWAICRPYLEGWCVYPPRSSMRLISWCSPHLSTAPRTSCSPAYKINFIQNKFCLKIFASSLKSTTLKEYGVLVEH